MSETHAAALVACPEACRQALVQQFAAVNERIGDECDTTITTAPPLIPSPWTQAFTCPHGVRFYMEPTGDQRAAWARDGVL